MFKQHSDVVTLWRSSKIDLVRGQSSEGLIWISVISFDILCSQVVWILTWVSTLLFNMDLGLAASIIFALLTVIFRTQM